MNALKKYPFFYWLHGLVAAIGLVVCFMLFNASEGHPPGIVFLPIAVPAWLIIHAFLAFIEGLANRSRNRALEQNKGPSPWPLSLLIVVVLCTVSSIITLAGVSQGWFSVEKWSTHKINSSFAGGISFICLVGILLRRNWGRQLTGTSCLLLSGYFAYKVIRSILFGHSVSVIEGIFGFLMISGFGYLGYHILTSQRIKNFIVTG